MLPNKKPASKESCDISKIIFALASNENIKDVIIKSGLTAQEIEGELSKAGYNSCFQLISRLDSTKLIGLQTDLITFLAAYGFDPDRTSEVDYSTPYHHTLTSGKIWLAKNLLMVGAKPLSKLFTGESAKYAALQLIPNMPHKAIGTTICPIDAIGDVLKFEINGGIDINSRGDFDKNALSVAFRYITSYANDYNPEHCLKILEQYFRVGADYLASGTNDGKSCLSNFKHDFSGSKDPYKEELLAIKILFLLEDRYAIKPLPADYSNPIIAKYVNERLSMEASGRLDDLPTLKPRTRKI